MLRVFVALSVLFFLSYACDGGYTSCKKKVLDSKATITDTTISIPLKNSQKLLFIDKNGSKDILKSCNILKSDPFLSLYLIEDKHPFKYPFRINMHQPSGYGFVTPRKTLETRVAQKQVGLNMFAQFTPSLAIPSLLTNSCCALEGIATSKGVIQKHYIQRFLTSKENSYGDIGVRIKEQKKFVVVESVDPFYGKNPFKVGDCILLLNGKKVDSAAKFMKEILFAKQGSKQTIKMKRDLKNITVVSTTHKRVGGGFLSDTFLEQKGLYFNTQLKIISLSDEGKKLGLKVGDKLLQVNGVKVSTQEDVRHHIANFKEFAYLLFFRDGFEFFIHVK